MSPSSGAVAAQPRVLRPWHFVLAFGVVSLLADMVYEGARSIIGPYLATLGASATVVGLVAGAGEFIGYGLRVISGYAVRRTRRYWTWTIVGYALTVLSVPLIGVTGVLAPALLLYGVERLGKAVRSPAKDTLLSHASAGTGRGSAFGVHQALDQLGAVLGPLVLAAMLSWREGDYRLAFGVLAVPGLLTLPLVMWLRRRVPEPRVYEFRSDQPRFDQPRFDQPRSDQEGVDVGPAHDQAGGGPVAGPDPGGRTGLTSRFWQYAAAIAILSCGVASFPLLAYHAQTRGLLTGAQVPVLFAVAMLVDGASGLVVGRAYDRHGPITLLSVPIAAGVSAVAFTDSVLWVWIGVAVWGLVNGVMDSTVKAVVTDLVPSSMRAVAFGWLALVRGVGLLVAGGILGAAYDRQVSLAVGLILVANLAALAGLALVLRRLTS